MNSKPIVGIIGGHYKNTNNQALYCSELLGELLAAKGLTIACGGEDGIMESVCRGAKKSNGTTIGITKGNQKGFANKYIDYEITTALDLAFMNVLIWTSDIVVGFDGRYGTMCEIGLVMDIGKPLVLIGEHKLINLDGLKDENLLVLKEYSDKNVKFAINYIERKIGL